jgi:hypothetical protein
MRSPAEVQLKSVSKGGTSSNRLHFNPSSVPNGPDHVATHSIFMIEGRNDEDSLGKLKIQQA